MKKYVLLACAIGSIGSPLLVSSVQAADGFESYGGIEYKVKADGSSTYKTSNGTQVDVNKTATNDVLTALSNKTMSADQLVAAVSSVAKAGEDMLAGKVPAPAV